MAKATGPTGAATVASTLAGLVSTLAAPSEGLYPSRRSKVAIVAGNGHHAADLAGQFGLNRATRVNDHMMILYPGQSIAGHRFSLVLVTRDFHEEVYHAGVMRKASLDRWISDDVVCRLDSPDAKIIRL